MDLSKISFIRHEIRTSLNHILGYSEILQEDASVYALNSVIPGLKYIVRLADEIKDKVSTLIRTKAVADYSDYQQVVKDALFIPLYDIIGETQNIRQKLPEQYPQFESDLIRILAAANSILDLMERFFRRMNLDDLARRGMGEDTRVTSNLQALTEEMDSSDGYILIVDDEEINRELLSRHLGRQGYTIFTAQTGAAAFEILDTHFCDLIILDIMMPEMNGYKVLELLKTNQAYAHIPVIIISALGDMTSVTHCIELGAEDYLPKSFDPILLKARVSASIEKKRLRDKEKAYMNALLESQAMLNKELAEAGEYVRSLLPERLNGAIQSNHIFIPSQKLGGDCFGYHDLDEDHLAIYLLDVSGHGVGAALLSVSVQNVLRSGSLIKADFHSPSEVLNALNGTFRMESQNQMYFSIWYGVYNRKTRELQFAGAGAPPAVLVNYHDPESRDRACIAELSTENMIIGVDDDHEYVSSTCRVPEKSALYLFSDGSYEVRKKNGQMLDFQEYKELLIAHQRKGFGDLEPLVNQIKGLSQKDHFDDDVSLLALFFE